MICKNTYQKIKLLALSCYVMILCINFFDYQRYQMYVNINITDESKIVDFSKPWNEYWFNARKWLNNGKYVRVDIDKQYVINTKGVSFTLNSSNKQEFINSLYFSMKYHYPRLKNQDVNEFYSKLSSLKFEYLFSKFDQDIKEPNIHSYIVSFIYNDSYFETIMEWNEESDRLNIGLLCFKSEQDACFREFVGKKISYRKL